MLKVRMFTCLLILQGCLLLASAGRAPRDTEDKNQVNPLAILLQLYEEFGHVKIYDDYTIKDLVTNEMRSMMKCAQEHFFKFIQKDEVRAPECQLFDFVVEAFDLNAKTLLPIVMKVIDAFEKTNKPK